MRAFPGILQEIPRNHSEHCPRSLHSPRSVPRSCIPGFTNSFNNTFVKMWSEGMSLEKIFWSVAWSKTKKKVIWSGGRKNVSRKWVGYS